MISRSDRKFILDNFHLTPELSYKNDDVSESYTLEQLLNGIPIKVWRYRAAWAHNRRFEISLRPDHSLPEEEEKRVKTFGSAQVRYLSPFDRWQTDISLSLNDNHQTVAIEIDTGAIVYLTFHDGIILIGDSVIGEYAQHPCAPAWSKGDYPPFNTCDFNLIRRKYSNERLLSPEVRGYSQLMALDEDEEYISCTEVFERCWDTFPRK